jgi:hypothetical protein
MLSRLEFRGMRRQEEQTLYAEVQGWEGSLTDIRMDPGRSACLQQEQGEAALARGFSCQKRANA